MLKTYCAEKNIPISKLNDIALKHLQREQRQLEIKTQFEGEHFYKVLGSGYYSGQQNTGTQKETLDQSSGNDGDRPKLLKDYHTIFPEVPTTFDNVGFISEINESKLSPMISNMTTVLWKREKRQRLDKMIERIPRMYPGTDLLVEVSFK